MDRVFLRESRPQWARDLEFNIRAIARNQGMRFSRGRIDLHPADEQRPRHGTDGRDLHPADEQRPRHGRLSRDTRND